MDFVALLKFNSSSTAAERDAAMARRAGWSYPKGVRVITEHWPMSSECEVVSVFSVDDIAPIFEFVLEWSDVFDIDVSPAISAEQGLQLGGEMLGRLTRFQGS